MNLNAKLRFTYRPFCRSFYGLLLTYITLHPLYCIVLQCIVPPFLSLFLAPTRLPSTLPGKNWGRTGSFLTKDVVKQVKHLAFKKFQITIDGDREYHNKIKKKKTKDNSSSFDVTLQNINNALNELTNCSVILRINYDNKNIQSKQIVRQVNEILDEKNRNRVFLLFRKVWQIEFNKARKEAIKKMSNLCSSSGYVTSCGDFTHNFISCYADKKYYNAILYDGSVLKCTARTDLFNKKYGELDNDGRVNWNKMFFEKYSKFCGFENKYCLQCKHLPICMGKCKMNYDKRAESDSLEDFCKKGSNDLKFNDLIIEYCTTLK